MDLSEKSTADVQQILQRVATKSNMLQQLIKQFCNMYPNDCNDFINLQLQGLLLQCSEVVCDCEDKLKQVTEQSSAE